MLTRYTFQWNRSSMANSTGYTRANLVCRSPDFVFHCVGARQVQLPLLFHSLRALHGYYPLLRWRSLRCSVLQATWQPTANALEPLLSVWSHSNTIAAKKTEYSTRQTRFVKACMYPTHSAILYNGCRTSVLWQRSVHLSVDLVMYSTVWNSVV